MEMLIAALDPESISTARRWGVTGVVTNPTTFEDDGRPWRIALQSAVATHPSVVHVQVTEDTTDAMIEQVVEFRDLVGDLLVVKIPMSPAGLAAVTQLRAQGVRTNVTAVSTVYQAIAAAQAGADFISVYVGRIDKNGGHGIETLGLISQYLRANHPHIALVAASIHNLHQLSLCALNGADYAAVEPPTIRATHDAELTADAVVGFDRSWTAVLARG